jgi:hypothetical protein
MARNFPFYRTKGHYSVAVDTGAVAAGMASNGQLLQFRWTDTTHLAVITEISVTGMRATTAFAVGAIDLKATVARAYTVDGSGGTALEFGGDSNIDNAALRTNMGDSLVGDLRVATTAALTAGTASLEANDIGHITTHSSGGWSAATPIIGSIYLPTTTLFKADFNDGSYPLVLAQDEGFVVRAVVPATGVWNLGMLVKWTEVTEK